MNKCGIVKDLLPLYADDVCTPESKKFVAEHLAECKECCKELESFNLDVRSNSVDEKKAVKRFKKKTERRVAVKVISLILTICIGVFGVVNIYWYFGFRKPLEDANGLANKYTLEANDNTPTIDIILGENNPYNIDTEKYKNIRFEGHTANYLTNYGFIRIVLGEPSKKGIVYKGTESLDNVSKKLTVRQDKKGNYTYTVSFDYLEVELFNDHMIGQDDYEVEFNIDENMNLILLDADKMSEMYYRGYTDMMSEEEARDYVRERITIYNTIKEEIYQEVYEDLRVMMIVLYEGFGIGNVNI